MVLIVYISCLWCSAPACRIVIPPSYLLRVMDIEMGTHIKCDLLLYFLDVGPTTLNASPSKIVLIFRQGSAPA